MANTANTENSTKKQNKMYWGCSIPARIPFVECSARIVFEKLNIPFSDLENSNCCPDPTGLSSMDHMAWLSLGARNLSLVKEGETLISMCSGCIETLKTVNYMLETDQEAKEKINANLSIIGKKYDGNVEIRHGVELLYDNKEKIKNMVSKPLEGFKVAVHYGCHFLRPSHIINYDNPLAPVTMDEIVEILGAESVDYNFKLDCCGCPVGKADEGVSNELTNKKLENMEKAGANCIVVACPACFTQFDFSQITLNKTRGKNYYMPVFYITELIALAMGLDPKDMGFKFHGIKTKKFMEATNFFAPK